jgi:phage shock protein E
MTRQFLGIAMCAALAATLVGCDDSSPKKAAKGTNQEVASSDKSGSDENPTGNKKAKGNAKAKSPEKDTVATKDLEVPYTQDSIADIQKAVDEGRALLVDVRTQQEWDDGHFEIAKLYTVDALRDDSRAESGIKDLPKDKPIYLHCAAGRRAATAAKILKAKGYDPRPLQAGFAELAKNGLKRAGSAADSSDESKSESQGESKVESKDETKTDEATKTDETTKTEGSTDVTQPSTPEKKDDSGEGQ